MSTKQNQDDLLVVRGQSEAPGSKPSGTQNTVGGQTFINDFVPRYSRPANATNLAPTAPALSPPSQAKPLLQPQYKPRIPVKAVPDIIGTATDSSVAEASKPTTSIAFHVPGEHSEPRIAPPKDNPITTFDRDAPPPIAVRGSNPTGKRGQGLKDTLSILGVLVSALVLPFGLITFVFQSYQVDGRSMQTTLQNGDHLIVWKVQRTLAGITHHPYIPNRGDVIVFSEPGLSDFGQDAGKQLIKRVIGLPGERVNVKDGIITVYNKQYPDGFQPDKTLPYGSVIVTTPGNVDVTVGESQVFVNGDNRTNSLDSRVFGPVEAKDIVGKLVIRVLPLNTVKKF